MSDHLTDPRVLALIAALAGLAVAAGVRTVRRMRRPVAPVLERVWHPLESTRLSLDEQAAFGRLTAGLSFRAPGRLG
ncbi:hypothetical protein ABT160_17770 [Streptomyces sp. NPDC001941]|uniref:hypothetical protein n=1 Tax=Streptomyces sp. NPDC001941 TaxID=3154659 RepID=UPI00331DD12F